MVPLLKMSEVVVGTFGGAFNIRLGIKGFTSQAVIVTFS